MASLQICIGLVLLSIVEVIGQDKIERIDEDIRFMKSNSKFKNSRLAGQIITSIEPQLSSMLAIISSFIFASSNRVLIKSVIYCS